ncbi:S1 RNA-binding domain-containing protein [Streptomyces sp. NBC_01601]|uniref:S1 RNA-binding domain-containing protein n=1 Tax=Streptomyces sp. NBC_01601 TaxID=2975892 RepID=UPI002E2A1B18|nr:S1 RNA-binding domain-containing protein [Streptomyces sp. NBC_01601]
MPRFVHRITKYDPADRDEHGHYTGAEEPTSDHGAVEAAYLRSIAAFAAATGTDRLAIREPQIAGVAHFGLEPTLGDHGLGGLFPPDLSGFHDGAEVPLSGALELVRAMLRDHGVWCRLEAEDGFAVHVGWDQYVYVSSDEPCESALESTRALGLFPERLPASPYEPDFDEPGVQRPADDEFWARLRWSVASGQAALLEEGYVGNASRWHHLTENTLPAIRARLTPRAMLTVWPGLSADVDAALPLDVASRRPLFTAVLPDSDGVLRARWRTDQTPSDRDWAFLKTLRRGQIVTGVVTVIADFGVTFVDIGGFTAMINIPELSWRPISYPSEVVSVGQRITAEVLAVDMVRERVPLSLKRASQDV